MNHSKLRLIPLKGCRCCLVNSALWKNSFQYSSV